MPEASGAVASRNDWPFSDLGRLLAEHLAHAGGQRCVGGNKSGGEYDGDAEAPLNPRFSFRSERTPPAPHMPRPVENSGNP